MPMNEMLKCLALGSDVEDNVVVDNKPKSKIDELEEKVNYLTDSLDNLFRLVKEVRDSINREHDRIINDIIERKRAERKAEIPVGTILYGSTRGVNYFLEVKDDGFYVGEKKYDSLSAAAEAVSGVRRSGWTFWKLPDGRTVKEVYKDVITPIVVDNRQGQEGNQEGNNE